MTSSAKPWWHGRILSWRDEAVVRTAPWTDNRATATLTRAGIEYEKLVRAILAAPPGLVRSALEAVSRDEFARLTERVSAIEARLSELEESSIATGPGQQKRKK